MILNHKLAGHNRAIQIITYLSIVIWIVFQIAMICYVWNRHVYSDSANYISYATQALGEGSWYPLNEHFRHYFWICNMGYINLLELNMRLFGTFKAIYIEQLLLNMLLLWSVWRITLYFSSKTTAQLAVIIFCLLPSNLMASSAVMSDLPSMALFMLSFVLLRNNWRYAFVAGLIFAIANWTRPIMQIFLPSLILYAIYRKWKISAYVGYICGIILVFLTVGFMAYKTCGYPLTSSTTKGCNMIMGCWDNATGAYDDRVFEKGNPGYIPKSDSLNVLQNDSLLTHRSVEWIMDNPGKFISMIPIKTARLWGADVYWDKCYMPSSSQLSQKQRVMLSPVFYITLLLCLIGIWKLRRQLWGPAGIILLPAVLGTCMHFLMYGGLRYHYPMMPTVIFFAAFGLSTLLHQKTELRIKQE